MLLTGATGFVGGRLYDPLKAAGHDVICGSRHPQRARRQHPDRTWVPLDLGDEEKVDAALDGCDAAYFLVHAMTGADDDYGKKELAGAQRFAKVAGRRKLQRIVYLGGFEPAPEVMSKHLKSRLAVGHALRDGTVPCLELRASVIIGHGSASFQILRDLAARLPAMVFPSWLDNRTEPAAIDDVIAALVAGLEVPLPESTWFDLPGAEILSGREMLLRTAAILGVSPATMRVPLLTPRLSARWLWLISGVDYRLAQELVDGLKNDLLAERRNYRELAHLPAPIPFDEAVKRALSEETKNAPGKWWERVVRKLAPS
ncbi:MAG: NAD(P)H-binding protein [Polyangiaceae bacterium]